MLLKLFHRLVTMESSLHEIFEKASKSINTTIVFGNVSLFPQLIQFHLEAWFESQDDEGLVYKSLYDNLSTIVTIDPPFDARLTPCRQLVLTNHLCLSWPPNSKIVLYHVPHDNLQTIDDQVYRSVLKLNGDYTKIYKLCFNHQIAERLKDCLEKSRKNLLNVTYCRGYVDQYYFRIILENKVKCLRHET